MFRRFIRQILQSLPPILDMMGLLLFITVIYSVIGEAILTADF
jgi:two pore calcium channel protein 1